MHVFLELTTNISMKIDLHCQRQRCSPVTLVSGSISFMRVFAGVPWRGDVRQQWGCQKWQFSVLLLTVSSVALEVRPKLLYNII